MTIDFPFIWIAFKELLKAAPLTLILTFTPIIIGFFIGISVAMIRAYNLRFLSQIANGYVSFFRGTPAIMHIMLIYFGVPLLLDILIKYLHLPIQSNSIPIVLFVITALSLTAGSYLSEIIRSGISSVSQGQIEAAYAIGMNTFQVLKRIILPQALAQSIPNFTNLIIGFLHTTSIAFLVSQKEITGAANIIASKNLKFLEAFIAAGLLYWIITAIIEWVSYAVEKKAKSYNNSAI
ncbi:amino acid ABC transporter permease [Viridibacillus sp. FSL R5-0477]|uniref:Polar amino acid ABC transporter inner membrane subunit n=1 Tax=Viridibacillus arenosi FSL R5-213 TaxID=1227360 RepID=W4F5K8_9BACL|nr:MULTISPECIES: amino acid ABC transporter permease [Viridibacillus]ETT87411.1 polar amino acid ABC transporter inner membrane subunit [Viridibacillus arenosi FSL R5-213]OMC82481.1 cysteine ABC transporter permease [Viridibacillus sp. FSL H8-0123]OMC87771.1 cysteine ABC transporter permease [Viridibacillus sp. FSL H7-0596]OMC91319.1 cysteine ABC transporter permease [Viridibacillus arenosi]